MTSITRVGFLVALGLAAPFALSGPAGACGDSEAGMSCSENAAADDANWMLKRVVAEVKKDEPKALDEFVQGRNGFRTMDLYVFCIGGDGRIDAHPDSKLMGQDARALADPTGKHFAAEMLDQAQEGKITEVKYLFPKPVRAFHPRKPPS